MREVRQGQFYRHFKNRMYQILAVAEHSETGERMVVYQALYGDYRVYVRPYEMFVSEVDREKYPQATQKYRFEPAEPTKESEPESEQEKAAFSDRLSGAVGKTAGKGTKEEREEEINGEPDQALDKESGEEPEEASISVRTWTESRGVNPLLLEFLDAETLEEKLHIMIFGRNQMDDSLLNSIAISLDLVVDEKSMQEKYDEILNCLSMMERFECNRLR